jgi:oligopeptide transport system permease protein
MADTQQPDKRQIAEPEIHVGPEYAVAERDVAELVTGEVIAGSSLWRDAWRRLLRNRLAVFGMFVVLVLAVASVIGPAIIKRATGHTYESIPKDNALLKSFAPFRGQDGKFSWTHPWERITRARYSGACALWRQISLMVALIATLVSLVIGVSYGAIAGYLGGRVDDLMMRIVDVLYSLPYVILVIVLLALLPAKTPTRNWRNCSSHSARFRG